MLEGLQWMSVRQKLDMNVLVIVFKMKHNMYPTYLCDKICLNNEFHNYNLRNVLDFRLQFLRSNNSQNMITYEALKMYNELPNELKSIDNLKKFRIEIAKFVKSKN